MATLSTAYTNSRLLVPGSTSTAMPDSTLLVLANQFYRQLALQDTPRLTRLSGATTGLTIAAVEGQREMTTSVTNIARIHALRWEEAVDSSVDGRPIEYLPKDVFELERQTFPGSGGPTRCAYWERIPSRAWRVFIHPSADTSSDTYYSIECEIEPTDLSSGASTVLLTPLNFTRLEHLLAAAQARLLGRDQAFIDGILRDEVTKATFAKWLATDEGRGTLRSNEGRHG